MRSHYLPQHDAFIRWHEIVGDEPPVVYLPGLGIPSTANFHSVATHPVMRGRRALLIDYLGCGVSDHTDRFKHTLEEHSDTIAAVLDACRVRACSIVGHSMGGSVGISLALSRPDLVENLIVSESNLTAGGGASSRPIAAFALEEFVAREFPRAQAERRRDAANGDSGATFLAGAWAHVDPVGLHGNATTLVNIPSDFKERFLRLDVPRTFIYGRQDYPGEGAPVRPDAPDPQELTESGVRIAVVAEAGHHMMLDNLDGYISVLRSALRAGNNFA